MKGFSIIEVIIALSILLMGITSVIKLQSTGASMTSVSSNITQAQNLAQQVLQQQLSRSPSEVISSHSCSGVVSPITINNTDYEIICTVSVNELPLKGKTDHKIGMGDETKFTSAATVYVTVKWDENSILGTTIDAIGKKSVNSIGIVTYQ